MLKENVDYSRFNLKNKLLIAATHVMGLPFTRQWKVNRYFQRVLRDPETGYGHAHEQRRLRAARRRCGAADQFEPKVRGSL